MWKSIRANSPLIVARQGPTAHWSPFLGSLPKKALGNVNDVLQPSSKGELAAILTARPRSSRAGEKTARAGKSPLTAGSVGLSADYYIP